MSAMAHTVQDDDVREALRSPSPAEARESLLLLAHATRKRPEASTRGRREARAMVAAWEERVRSAEIEHWGGGWLGRAAGGLAVARSVGAAVAVRRIIRFLVPGKFVVGVMAVMLGMTLLAGIALGALLAALL